MKSALAIVLMATLTCGAFPLSAQEPGPIARSIEREAARMAQAQPVIVTHGRSRSSRILKDTLIGAGIGGSAAALMGAGVCQYCTDEDKGEAALLFGAGGAGVGALVGAIVGALGGRDSVAVVTGRNRPEIAAGTLVFVSRNAGAPAERTFVHAGDADIVVMNTSPAALPRTAVNTLRDIAVRNPAALIAAEAGESRVLDNIRLGRDGVFVSGQKIAELTQIVERIPRADIEAGRSTVVVPGSKGMGLAGRIAIGAAVGFVTAVFTGAALCIGRCGG